MSSIRGRAGMSPIRGRAGMTKSLPCMHMMCRDAGDACRIGCSCLGRSQQGVWHYMRHRRLSRHHAHASHSCQPTLHFVGHV